MVKNGMFLGQFNHNLDGKNRIIIPVRFREEIDEVEVFVSKGVDNCLEIRKKDDFKIWISQLSSLGTGIRQARILTRNIMSTSEKVKIDSLGRIKISTTLCELIGVKNNVNSQLVVIGNNDKIELWALINWQKYMQENKGWEKLIDNFSKQI